MVDPDAHQDAIDEFANMAGSAKATTDGLNNLTTSLGKVSKTFQADLYNAAIKLIQAMKTLEAEQKVMADSMKILKELGVVEKTEEDVRQEAIKSYREQMKAMATLTRIIDDIAKKHGINSEEVDKAIKTFGGKHTSELQSYVGEKREVAKAEEEKKNRGLGNTLAQLSALRGHIGHPSDTFATIGRAGGFGKAGMKMGQPGAAGAVIIAKEIAKAVNAAVAGSMNAPLKVFQGMKSLKGLEDIDALFKEISGVMSATIDAISGVISGVMEGVSNAIEAGLKGVTDIITALVNVATTIMNLIIDSSPMLQGMLKLFMKMVNLILMPIGNIIAMVLLPILRNNVRGIMELVKSGNKLLNEIMNGDFSGLTDFLQKVGSTLGNMLGQIFTTLSPVISQIFTDVFPSLMNSLTMPGKDAKGNATDSPLQVFVKNVIKVITDQGVIDAIGKAAWQGITTALRELFNYLLGQIPNPFSSVKDSLDGIMNPFESIKNTIGSITNPFTDILSSIGSITDPFSSLKLSLDGITNPLDSIGSSITNFFGADGVGGITNPLSGMLSWFTDFFGDKGLKQITNPFDGILSWFTDFFGGTDSIGKNAEGTKTNPLSGVLGFITDFFEPFKTMTDPFASVTGFFNDFKAGFNITDPFKSVGDFFSTFKNLFSGITDDPFKIFTDFFNTFKRIFTGIVNDPFKIFTGFFNTFKGVFDKIVNDPFKMVTDFFNTFKNIFNISDPFATIRGYFDTFFGFLTGKDVKTPFQFILDIIGKTFNGVISLANKIIALNPLNWLGGTQIGNITIPQLADGGIVTSATQAIIGEAGPEAVIPLDKIGSMGFGNAKVTININGNVLGTADDLENAIRNALNQYQMEQQYR